MSTQNPAFVDLVKKMANDGFQRLYDLDGRKRPGGYMCVIHRGKKYIFKVGEPEAEELAASWIRNCQDKANRLVANPDHISARQSSDFAAKKYYGGIRIPHTGDIITFSGSYEELDEAFCSSIAAKIEGGLTEVQWREIAEISGNTRMSRYGEMTEKIAA